MNPDPSHDTRWLSENITEWPVRERERGGGEKEREKRRREALLTLTLPSSQICQESQTRSNSEHLSCNLTGRPCCVGIQSHCLITTLEHCDFLEGKFHSDAFLCSQVRREWKMSTCTRMGCLKFEGVNIGK